nr:hypothetical protein [Nocardia jiangxiensis]
MAITEFAHEKALKSVKTPGLSRGLRAGFGAHSAVRLAGDAITALTTDALSSYIDTQIFSAIWMPQRAMSLGRPMGVMVAVPDSIAHILTSSTPSQIIKTIICGIPVEMTAFSARRRRTNEREQNESVHHVRPTSAINDQAQSSIPRLHSIGTHNMDASAPERANPSQAADGVGAISAWDGSPTLFRFGYFTQGQLPDSAASS